MQILGHKWFIGAYRNSRSRDLSADVNARKISEHLGRNDCEEPAWSKSCQTLLIKRLIFHIIIFQSYSFFQIIKVVSSHFFKSTKNINK